MVKPLAAQTIHSGTTEDPNVAFEVPAGGALTNTDTGKIRGGITGVWFQGGGTLDNLGGLVAGGESGVKFDMDGIITNTGTIYGTALLSSSAIRSTGAGTLLTITNTGGVIFGYSDAISLAYGGEITNTAGGLIRTTSGVNAAILISGLGTMSIINTSGTIIGGYGIFTNATGSIDNTGRIQGIARHAIHAGGSATITNSGTIHGTRNGIYGAGGSGAFMVTNSASGLITGEEGGIYTNRSGTITNHGEISSTDFNGIEANQSLYIGNTGTIEGGLHGVSLSAGGTVVNSGIIRGLDSTDGAGISATNTVITATNHGLIEGGRNGIASAAGGVFYNTGTLSGLDGHGLWTGAGPSTVDNASPDAVIAGAVNGGVLNGGGTVTNAGRIMGTTNNGVFFLEGGAVANTGTISGGGFHGVSIDGAPGHVTNTGVNATLAGGRSGVWLYSGTVINSGLITGTTLQGVYGSSNGPVTITNDATGRILGGDNGVLLAGAGDITNDGIITGTSAGARLLAGGTVINTGTIAGETDDGILVSGAPAHIDNRLGGEIAGNVFGIEYISGATGTVTNAGRITGTNWHGVSGATVVNNAATGVITSVNNTAIMTGGADSAVNNAGLIDGNTHGIEISGDGTVITNSGTIRGATDAGVFSNDSAIVTNTTGGLIIGPANAINLRGTITPNQVHLYDSSTLAGNLSIAGASSLLTLNGDDPASQYYSDAVTGVTTFTGTLAKRGAGTWTLDRDMTMAGTDVQTGTLMVLWDDTQLNDAPLNIAADATASVRTDNDATIANPLTGSGRLELLNMAMADDRTFTLAATTGGDFQGTLALGGLQRTGNLLLDANAAAALAQATLELDSNGEATVDAPRTIHNLTFDGGTLILDNITFPPATMLTATGTLAVTANSGTVILDPAAFSGSSALPVTPPFPDQDNYDDFFTQSTTIAPGATLLVGAATVVGDVTQLDLVAGTGSTATGISFYEGGAHIVDAYYDYAALTGTNSGTAGLWMSYNLTRLDLQDQQSLTLNADGSGDRTLAAKLTGDGSLVISNSGATTGTITLSNNANTYTGTTIVTAGNTLRAGAANAIATSAALDLGDAAFETGAFDQAIQSLRGSGEVATETATTLTLVGGSEGVFTGSITGAGAVVKTGDDAQTIGAIASTGLTTVDAGHLIAGSIAADLRNNARLTIVTGTFGGTSAINTGTITGAPIGIRATNTQVLVTNIGASALIEGAAIGVKLVAGGTLANSGMIRGSSPLSRGVYADAIATVVNNPGALIEGDHEGVYLNVGGTVSNDGTIRGYGENGDGVYSLTPSASISIANNSAGLIEGSWNGIYTAGSLDVINSGTINGAAKSAIFAAGRALVTNTTGALINGGESGVSLGGGGTVANHGVIRGGEDGVFVENGSAQIINHGLIEGAQGLLLETGAGGSVIENAAGGMIRGTTTGGIATSDIITVVNHAGADIAGVATGVALISGGTVTNAGNIRATEASGAGIISLGSMVVTNTTGGVIGGASCAMYLLNGVHEVRLWNSSTLEGALYIGNDASSLILDGDTSALPDAVQLYSDAVTGSTTFTGTLIKRGDGTWEIDSSAGLLGGFAQAATLVQAGTLAVQWAGHQLNSAPADIASAATLHIKQSAPDETLLSSTFTGDGYVDYEFIGAAGASSLLLEDAGVLAGFSGTLGVRGAVGATRFALDDTAEDALANATLRLGINGVTTLDDNRAIRGFHLGGGVIHIQGDPAAAEAALYKLTVDDFKLDTSSTVGIDPAMLSGILPPQGGLSGSVFDIDVTTGGSPSHVIIDATLSGATSGQTAALVNSADGTGLGTSSTMSFANTTGGSIVGENYYGHQAVVNVDGDLELAYGLTEIRSTNAAEAVIIDPTGSRDKTLSALLSDNGSGAGFTFAGSDTITLARRATYSGTTTIGSGLTFKAGDADIIASSNRVILDAASAFDLNAFDQTLRNVSGAGAIRLGANTLTISNTIAGLVYAGSISGDGKLVLSPDSTWTLTGANAHTGGTELQGNALLVLGDGGVNGSITGDVASSGTLAINRSDAVTFAGAITGAGVFIQRGSGTTTLTGANAIAGGLVVERGTLRIGSGASDGWASGSIAASVRVEANAGVAFNRNDLVIYSGTISGAGNVSVIGAGTVALTASQAYTGETRVSAGTLRTDVANAITSSSRLTLANGTFDLNNTAQTVAAINSSSGRIRYGVANGTGTVYTTLTVAGAFEGGSTHYMNIDLVGARSDRLFINGAASGTHAVVFNSTNPAELDNPNRDYALQVVKFASGDPLFTSNVIESGMLDYQLYRGDGGAIMPDVNAYYVSAGDDTSRAGDAILLTAGVMGADWHYGLDTLRLRMGDIRSNLVEGKPVASIWARANAYALNASPQLGGSRFDQTTWNVSAGGDRVFGQGGRTLTVGAFLSMGRTDRDFEDAQGEFGEGETSSVGAGGYVLWLYESGWYVDAVARLDRYSNKLTVRGADGFVSSGKFASQVLGASIESGRRFSVGDGGIFWFEPQAQAATAFFFSSGWPMMRDGREDMPVHIETSISAQIAARVTFGADLGDRWRPYARFGLVKGYAYDGTVSAQGRKFDPYFDGSRFETGFGTSYLIDEASQVYLDYEYNKANHYERPWSINLGYRRAW